ncbi:efflux RND transporter periplasmic adaptor subunit [Altericista sp. CCNU0014]|uniref:efflux RND transporter periplasmic adaptor subunit n=1 Tax=Altericista sp. CCNU0014 TaxID=3082949 RepID=UPI0038513AA7
MGQGIYNAGKVSWPKSWVVALIGAGLIGIGAGTFALTQRNRAAIDLSQYTVPVKSEPFTLRISATGTITPVQSVNLSPKTAGVLKRLLVEQGDRVEQGQIIAYMDQQDLKGQLLQAQAGVAQARANLEKLRNGSRPEEIAQSKARLNQAQQQLLALRNGNRTQEIDRARAQVASARARVNLANSKLRQYTQLKDAGAVSLERYNEINADVQTAAADLTVAQQNLDLLETGTRSEEVGRAQASVDEARAAYSLAVNGTRSEDIRQAEAQVDSAVGQLEVVQSRLADTVICAPFSGVVTQKYASIGAFVTPTTSASSTSSATSTSIVAVAQELEILAKIAEVDIGKIRLGQPVEINVDSYPEKVFKGRVRLVSPEAVIDQNVTTFQVRVSILTGQNQLLSGMNADLMFLGEKVADALVIPTVAIATRKGETGVYLPDSDNKPKFQPITIGASVKTQTQVLEGLSAGQRVFIDYPKGLEPKQPEEGKN